MTLTTAKRPDPAEWIWVIADYHLRPGCASWVSVEDGPSGVPTWEDRPRVVFVPTTAGHPIGTTEHDPPTYWSGTILEAFVAAFGQRFGEPRVVEGRDAGVLGWCPFVVYALAQPCMEST